MAKANLALARTCLCRGGRLVRPARQRAWGPQTVRIHFPPLMACFCTQPGRGRPGLHKTGLHKNRHYTFYCGNPFDTTSTLSVTVPKLWPPLSAVQVNVCHVPFCAAELLIVS